MCDINRLLLAGRTTLGDIIRTDGILKGSK